MNDKKPRIIVVDDDEIIRDTLPKILQVINYEVVGTAKNGLEAISLYRSTNPDIVLLDVNMPIKTGDQVLEILKDNVNQSCFIMISFISEIDIVKKCIDRGAFYYIKKDLPLPQMLDVIEKTWEKYKKIYRSEHSADNSLHSSEQNYIYNKIREDKFAYMLMERNFVDKPKLQKLLTEKNGDIFEVLIQLATENPSVKKDLGWLWAASIDTSFISVATNKVNPALLSKMTANLAEKLCIIPLYQVGASTTIAFSKALSMQEKHSLSKIFGDNVDYVFSFPDEINTALSLNYK